ncbi:MAG: phosphoribosylanthranilate isomerase [Paenibacillaceae bacterium]
MNATKPTIKICGLRTIPMVVSLGTLAIDDVGFVFASGKRTVTAEFAGTMIKALRLTGSFARAVGVFENPSLDMLAETLKAAPLDVLQLHGQESPEFCKEVKQRFNGIAICKVFSVKNEVDQMAIASQLDPYQGLCDSILLDTYDPHVGGGTGETFAWNLIPTYQAWAVEAGIPLIIAGGLKPDNVGELVKIYKPDGVDVSSGVETDGMKDILLIKAFIERVRQHD